MNTSGGPLAGATIQVYTETGVYKAQTTTDALGAYSVTLPEGTYRIRALKLPSYLVTYLGGPTFATAEIITLNANTTRDMTLVGRFTISGVVSTSGGPLVGATIQVYVADTAQYKGAATTNASGAYTLTLTEGSYRVRSFRLPDFLVQYVGGSSFGTASVITLDANTALDIVR